MTDFTLMKAGLTNAIYSWRKYKGFLHGVNGTDEVLFDESGNLYPATVANPTAGSLAGASGAAGNPDGVYSLYVSFLITFPDGQKYETGICDASADVTVASEKIEWSNIPVSSYAKHSGSDPTIHRKLYRGPGTGGTLGDIYYVATISDNSTTTYSDDFTDSELAANGACTVDTYIVGPADPLYLEYHYGRLFYISKSNVHRLYHSEVPAGDTADDSEVLMPLAFASYNWDDLRTAGFGEVAPQGLIAWGSYIYIPLKHTWIRKSGNDPDTWSFKKTWANLGIGAPHSLAICEKMSGILGVSTPRGGLPGITLFNGQTSQMVSSPMLDDIFESDLNHSAINKCRGAWDGRYYHLLYPHAANTEPTKHIAVDLSRAPDNIRIANWEDITGDSGKPRCVYVNDQDDGVYFGDSVGYGLKNSGTETIDIDVRTVERIGGDPKLANVEKTFKSLKYNLDSGDDDITLTIYIDGTAMAYPDETTTKTITGDGDAVQYLKDFPTNWKGYRYSIRLQGTGLSTFKLYSPWEAVFDATGE